MNVALPTISRGLARVESSSRQWIVDGYSLPFSAHSRSPEADSRIGGDENGSCRSRSSPLRGSRPRGLLRQTRPHAVHGPRADGGARPSSSRRHCRPLTVVFEDRAERAKAFGLWGAPPESAIALGPIAGGALITAALLLRFDLPRQRPRRLDRRDGHRVRRARVDHPRSTSAGLRGVSALGTSGVTALILANNPGARRGAGARRRRWSCSVPRCCC